MLSSLECRPILLSIELKEREEKKKSSINRKSHVSPGSMPLLYNVDMSLWSAVSGFKL